MGILFTISDARAFAYTSQTTLGIAIDDPSDLKEISKKLLYHFNKANATTMHYDYKPRTTFISSMNVETLDKLAMVVCTFISYCIIIVVLHNNYYCCTWSTHSLQVCAHVHTHTPILYTYYYIYCRLVTRAALTHLKRVDDRHLSRAGQVRSCNQKSKSGSFWSSWTSCSCE